MSALRLAEIELTVVTRLSGAYELLKNVGLMDSWACPSVKYVGSASNCLKRSVSNLYPNIESLLSACGVITQSLSVVSHRSVFRSPWLYAYTGTVSANNVINNVLITFFIRVSFVTGLLDNTLDQIFS